MIMPLAQIYDTNVSTISLSLSISLASGRKPQLLTHHLFFSKALVGEH
jgi:hypothetical protein